METLHKALLDQPRRFDLSAGRAIFVYAPTLASTLYTQPLYEQIQKHADTHRLLHTAAQIIAAHTTRTPDNYAQQVEETALYLTENATEEEIAQLLQITLQAPAYNEIAAATGIEAEVKRIQHIMQAKKDHSTLATGGITLCGNLIDAALARYGWTLHYTLYQVPLATLLLILSDRPDSIYLTPDELKRLPACYRTRKSEQIQASSENINQLINLLA